MDWSNNEEFVAKFLKARGIHEKVFEIPELVLAALTGKKKLAFRGCCVLSNGRTIVFRGVFNMIFNEFTDVDMEFSETKSSQADILPFIDLIKKLLGAI